MARRWIQAIEPATDESMASRQSYFTISGITQANPGVVSATGHTLVNGDTVIITGVVGMTEVNDRLFTVASVVAGVSFALSGVNTSLYTAWSSGGAVHLFNELSSSETVRVHYNDGGSGERIAAALQRAKDRLVRELG